MTNAPRLALIIAILVVSYILSPEMLFPISAGIVAAYLVVRWRTAPKEPTTRPVEAATLEKGAAELGDAAVKGEQVWTAVGDRAAMVTLGHTRSTMGELPTIRLEVRMGAPIQFCFTLRRRLSLFPMPVLVWNTMIPKASFEYELKRVEVRDESLRRFELAANHPRLMARLWETRLAAGLGSQQEPHQLRLEELAFNGETLIFYYMPAYELEPDPQLHLVIEEATAAAEALDEFIRSEALRDATSA
jgi:hypothetical protein